jgi:hypothetical protein
MTPPPAALAAFTAARLDDLERCINGHLCIRCGHPVIPLRNLIGITGYTHHGQWQWQRCPGMLTGAQPVQDPGWALRDVAAKRNTLEDVLSQVAATWSDHPDYPEARRP